MGNIWLHLRSCEIICSWWCWCPCLCHCPCLCLCHCPWPCQWLCLQNQVKIAFKILWDHLRQVVLVPTSVLSMTMHRQLYVHFALLKIPPKFMTHFLLCWKRNEERDKYEYEYSNISISISINIFTLLLYERTDPIRCRCIKICNAESEIEMQNLWIEFSHCDCVCNAQVSSWLVLTVDYTL